MSPIDIACPKCDQQPNEPCKWNAQLMELCVGADYCVSGLFHSERIEAQHFAETRTDSADIPDSVIEAAANDFI